MSPPFADFLTSSPRSPDWAAVAEAFRNLTFVDDVGDGVRFTTNCMFPSNGLVRVVVRGGVDTFVVSDEGETVGEALSAGIDIGDPDKVLAPHLKERGLRIRGGVIYTPKLSFDDACMGVLNVANASKELAHWLYTHNRVKRVRDFRLLLSSFLSREFAEQVSSGQFVGVSNKAHKFANVIKFANGKKLIVDPVAHDSSSINARAIANLDVRESKDSTIKQRIIYDDEEPWSSSDLNLLQIGAKVIPFSRSEEVITRLAQEVRVA